LKRNLLQRSRKWQEFIL
jgi:hypothetical protein